MPDSVDSKRATPKAKSSTKQRSFSAASSDDDDSLFASYNSAKQRSTPSMLNIVLLYIALLGIGALGGYGAFYSLNTSRCTELLDTAEREFNETSKDLHERYLNAVEQHHKCLTDDSTQRELYELRGRLDSQSSLVNRHQQLLEKHEETVEKLAKLQSSYDEAQRQLEASGNSQEMQAIIVDREQQIDTMSKELESCRTVQEAQTTDINHMADYVRNQHRNLSLQKYGEGVFHIELTVRYPKEHNSFIVIEVDARMELPHSVWMFLELVSNKVYNGSVLKQFSNNALMIGSSGPENKRLHRRVAEMNHGEEDPLAFLEYSPHHVCDKYGIEFYRYGPALVVQTFEGRRDKDSCFGKIIRGMDVIDTAQSFASSGKSISIIDASIVQLNLGDEL